MVEQKRNPKLELMETVPSKLSTTLSRGHELVILIVLFLTTFVIRMLTYNNIFVGDKIRFLEFDPFYHMRRAVSFAQNFPHTWSFDTYLNYPYGNTVGWPVLYDWTIALLANIIGFGNPSRHLIEIVGVYFPVFLGSLSVVVVYFVAKEIFSDLDVVKIDNDTFSKNTKTTKKSNKVQNGNGKSWKNVKSWQIGFVSGLLLAAIPAFVQISFLGFVDHHVAEVLLSTTAFLFFIKTLKAENSRNRYIFSALTIFVLILAMYTWPGTPIFIGILCIYAGVQCAVDKKYKFLALIIGALLTLYICIYFVSPDTYNSLNLGVGFLFKDRIALQQVQETQPLFFTFSGKFVTEPAWFAFNTSLYVAIVGIILFIIGTIRKWLSKNSFGNSTKPTRVRIFFLVWTLIALVLTLYQVRFAYLLAVNIAILCAYLIIELVNSNNIYIEILGVLLVATILVPSVQIDKAMVENPLMFSNDWFSSLEWLKNNTPDTNSNWNLPSKDQIPSYGIMSWWDYGNYILYLSERPVVANNFQLGAEDSAKFYSSENETEASQILKSRKAIYVIVDYRLGLNKFKENGNTYIRGTWVSVAFLSGKNTSYYLDEYKLPNDKYFNTMYAKLYLFDGKGLDNYKLIYKSDTRYLDLSDKPIEEIKIFEYTGW